MCSVTRLLEAGADVSFVQDWLGHANIQNTTLYGKLTSTRDAIAHKTFASQQELEMTSEAVRTFLTRSEHLVSSKQLIITNGNRESTVYSNCELVKVKPKPIPRIVNTLGCGDAFMAAYLVSHLKRLSPTECSEIAHDWAGKIAQLQCERSLELKLEV